jgi:hypothetical protein
MVAQIDSDYKRYGLGKVSRRIISYSLFEGRPHTTKGQWFNPVVFTFLRLMNSFPGYPTLNKPIFITGLGRSGTTILGLILSLHRDVGFLNEPKAIWRFVDSRHDINGDYVFSNGLFHLSENDVTKSAKNSAHKIFSRYLKLTNTNRLVDKYPELIFRTSYILNIFPDAKIIFITRNGADATHSIDLWSKRLGIKNKNMIEDWWGRNDIKWHYLKDQIIDKDPYYKDIRSIASDKLDHTNRAALEWIITMREGIKQKSKYTDSVYQLKYEDLLSSKSSAMLKLLDWCELSFDNAVLEYSDQTLYLNNPKPHPNLFLPIDNLFNETMEKLGY